MDDVPWGSKPLPRSLQSIRSTFSHDSLNFGSKPSSCQNPLTAMSLTIHHVTYSPSDQLVWLCEELSIPYTLKRYARFYRLVGGQKTLVPLPPSASETRTLRSTIFSHQGSSSPSKRPQSASTASSKSVGAAV